MQSETAGVPHPVTDPVSDALEQLVKLEPQCLYCADTIHQFDFFVAWPAADVVAHFGCYANAQHLVKDTARAEVRS
jgi:hypothetical protein